MQEQFKKLKDDLLTELKEIKNSDALRDLENKFLGRKGKLAELFKNIVNLDADEKKQIGSLANKIKKDLSIKIKEAYRILEGESDSDTVDVGIPGKKIPFGHLSPISQIQYELEDVFKSMGFMILDGPELESDYYNFRRLNIPSHHPARDMQDTFYIDDKKETEDKMVLRTHTSPMQVRAMQKYGPPLKCVVPGRVYRAEATDAVHEHTFDQMEGLMVGEGISLDNLIAVMKELLNGIFKKEMEVRIRPGFFPFVEPGIELDIKCTICHGAKCPACKHTGWLELLPAGMVHANVLKHGGIDPEKYTGFAFGLGLTRLAMMRYGIGDIRLFNSGDLRFINQF